MTEITDRPMNLQADTIPELQNGAGEAVTIPIRASAINEKYHWASILGMTKVGAAVNMKAYVRMYYGILGAKEVVRHNATLAADARMNTNAATYTEHAAAIAHVATVPLLKKEAMCIGVSRAGMITMWGIGLGAGRILTAEADVNPFLRFEANRVGSMHAKESRDMLLTEALALAMVDMTADEEDVLYAIFQLSMASVPLAGLSILNTGHHYLSGTNVATKSVMKQVVSANTEAVKAWFATDAVVLADMIWHKSAHPIDMAYLVDQALSPSVAERLRAAGIGSAAVRLPYVEPELKAAGAMVAIVNVVQNVVQEAVGILEVPSLEEAISQVKLFRVRAANVVEGTIAAKPTVVNRVMAIREVLEPVMKRAGPAVAYAMGIYSAMMENTSARDRTGTLMSARSLARVKSENLPTVAAGASFYENLMRRDRTEAAKGKIHGPNLTV